MNTLDSFREKYGLSGNALKMIAAVTMLIDHTGATFVRKLKGVSAIASDPELAAHISRLYYYMRRIGRLAFPIYCFLLVEGFIHTKNIRKYLGRMLVFALISEFPFDYALHHGQALFAKQNVYFTLLIGLLVIWVIHDLIPGQIAPQLLVMTAGLTLARFMRTDYSYRGVFLIETLYILRFSRLFQCLGGGAFIEYEKMPAPLAFLPVYLYNGKRGRQLKYFYYLFYPVHLMVLGIMTHNILPAFL